MMIVMNDVGRGAIERYDVPVKCVIVFLGGGVEDHVVRRIQVQMVHDQ